MKRFIPMADWLPGYQRSWLGGDFLAGATVWAVLIPSAMAYAGIVGVDPIVGLYTVPLALVAYAVFGTSRLLVVGPDAAISVLAAAVIVSVVAGNEYLEVTIALALITGVIYIIFSALRMGWIADVIPDPVTKGFIEGLVWITILDQVPKLLGITLPGESGRFLPKLIDTFEALPGTQTETAILGIACLVTLAGLRRFAPRAPGPLVVLIAAIAVVALLGLADKGVAVVGEATAGLGRIGLPTGLDAGTLLALVPGALAIVVLGFSESLGASSRAAEQTGERIDPDQELLALGMANLGAGLAGGYVVTGALSKTAVAIEAKGKTQMGNLFAAVLGVLTILFLLPIFADLALAVLAAIVIMAMAGLSDLGYFRSIWSVSKVEFAAAAGAFAGVLAIGVLGGIIIGVLLTIVSILKYLGRPPTAVMGRLADGTFADIAIHAEATEIPGVLVWQPDAPLLFLNARNLSTEVRQLVQQRPGIQGVVLDASQVLVIDSTSASAFVTLDADLQARGIDTCVTGATERTWSRLLAMAEIADVAPPRSFATNEEAVAAFDAGTWAHEPDGIDPNHDE